VRATVVASAISDGRIRVGSAEGGAKPQDARRLVCRSANRVADPQARIFDDPDHSIDERREIIIGYSRRPRLLIVGFTERAGRVRIITARRASRAETTRHEENT
jgi:uncharacterized DUF497 family protein